MKSLNESPESSIQVWDKCLILGCDEMRWCKEKRVAGWGENGSKWDRKGIKRECERMGSSLKWAWETYRRWFDLAQPHICSGGVMLRMIWEDERRKIVLERCFKKHKNMGSINTHCLLMDWMWLIFPHSVDKQSMCIISDVSWYTHKEEKVEMQ